MLRELLLVALALLLVVLVAPAEPPMTVGTVTDDAMAPSIDPGEAYLVTDPAAIETGDVIRFWAPTRGAYLTRRVVDRSPAGFITSGDGASRTDQAGGLPPVHPSAVAGVVYERGGQPVTVPVLGTLVGGLRTFRVPILGLLALLGALAFVREQRIERGPRRPIIRVRNIVLPLLAVGVVTTLAITPLGAASYQLSYAASTNASDPGSQPSGEPIRTTTMLPTASAPWERSVVRGRGVSVESVRELGNRTAVTVTIPPPDRTVRSRIQATPYPRVLPRSALEALHDVHPLLAVLSSLAVPFLPLLGLYWLLLDGRRPIAIPRWRWLHRLLGV